MATTNRYRNLADLLPVQAQQLGARIALRYKCAGVFRDLSWQEYAGQVEGCAAALVEAGLAPGDRVGLLSENRVEWLIADLGILAAGGVTVPLHASLAERQVHQQLADSGARCLFVSTASQWVRVQPLLTDLQALQTVVLFEGSVRDIPSWVHFLDKGNLARPRTQAERQRRRDLLDADTLATILYTSGTTGRPKGVMLTHGNLLSNAQAFLAALPMGPEEVRLNWLPFSHVFARTVDHYVSLLAGATLCLAESPDTVLADLADIQPTHLIGVPRFYEKVLAWAAVPDREETNRRLRSVFGPRVVWLKSGGAPLPPAIFQAYREAGLEILQGYGLTESSPDIATNRLGQNKAGTVGPLLPGVEVAIALDGEVLTRGPHVMKGYWNDPPATAEVLRDGWLHTGDLGRLDHDGFLTITGRKKDMIVLSTGKKVMPAHIEGLLRADPLIDQVVLYGEGRPFLTALVVPHWENLRQALFDNGVSLPGEAAQSLAESPLVRDFLASRLEVVLAEVSPWERVQKFLLLPRPFSVAAEELTVSLKLRRQAILAKYQYALARLYQN